MIACAVIKKNCNCKSVLTFIDKILACVQPKCQEKTTLPSFSCFSILAFSLTLQIISPQELQEFSLNSLHPCKLHVLLSGIFQLPLFIKMFFLRIFKCLFVLAGIKHFLGFSSKLTAFPHTNCKVSLCPTVNICSVFWPFHSVGPCLFCFFRIFDYAELYWFSM